MTLSDILPNDFHQNIEYLQSVQASSDTYNSHKKSSDFILTSTQTNFKSIPILPQITT
jgi:hypothetical protein